MQQKKLNWKWIVALVLVGIVIMVCGCSFLAIMASNIADTTTNTKTDTRVAEVEITATVRKVDTAAQDSANATDVAAMVKSTFEALDAEATITADAVLTVETTATSASTITPVSTATPAPTNTPVSTATRAPTNTPKPTQTQEPTVDLTEFTYMSKISTMSLDCQDYLMNIATQSQLAGEDVTLFLDTGWQVDTAIALVGIETSCVAMRDISPVPLRFATLHSYVEMMASEMQQMVDDYTYGVDHLDADRLLSAVEHMEKGTEFVKKMTTEIERLNQ